MRISKSLFIFICFVFGSFSILAEVHEKWSVEKAKVGDVIEYEFEFSDIPRESLSYPSVGFFPETGLPILEIVSLNEKENKFIFQVRFLDVGEFSFPIEWKDSNGNLEKANLKVKIESNLTGSEFDIYDITEPLEFSGPYLLKLLAWILGITFIAIGIAYVILKIKRKSELVLDAKFQTIQKEEKPTLKESELQKLLLMEEIPHKEFVYLLSFEVKNFLNQKYKIDTESFTNKELLNFIQSKSKINDLEKMRLQNYLDMIKYMPNEEKITRDFANKTYKTWMEILKK